MQKKLGKALGYVRFITSFVTLGVHLIYIEKLEAEIIKRKRGKRITMLKIKNKL
jgi:hypothetical protein